MTIPQTTEAKEVYDYLMSQGKSASYIKRVFTSSHHWTKEAKEILLWLRNDLWKSTEYIGAVFGKKAKQINETFVWLRKRGYSIKSTVHVAFQKDVCTQDFSPQILELIDCYKLICKKEMRHVELEGNTAFTGTVARHYLQLLRDEGVIKESARKKTYRRKGATTRKRTKNLSSRAQRILDYAKEAAKSKNLILKTKHQFHTKDSGIYYAWTCYDKKGSRNTSYTYSTHQEKVEFVLHTDDPEIKVLRDITSSILG